MGQADTLVDLCERLDRIHRILYQFFKRYLRIRNPVHKRRVGAIFQQSAHQISQQGLMGTHGRIDAAWPPQLAVLWVANNLLVERLAHAVETLKLVLTRFVFLRIRKFVDRRERVRVVGRKLRIDRIRDCKQLPCARNVGRIGIGLAGVHRIPMLPIDLGALDFCIPIGAFYQADHQPPIAAACKIDHVVDHKRATLLVGLDHESKPRPPGQLRFERKSFQ